MSRRSQHSRPTTNGNPRRRRIVAAVIVLVVIDRHLKRAAAGGVRFYVFLIHQVEESRCFATQPELGFAAQRR